MTYAPLRSLDSPFVWTTVSYSGGRLGWCWDGAWDKEIGTERSKERKMKEGFVRRGRKVWSSVKL